MGLVSFVLDLFTKTQCPDDQHFELIFKTPVKQELVLTP